MKIYTKQRGVAFIFIYEGKNKRRQDNPSPSKFRDSIIGLSTIVQSQRVKRFRVNEFHIIGLSTINHSE